MKTKLLIVMTCVFLILTGCGVKHVNGELEDIMVKLYSDISEEELPMMLQNTELTEENIENYIGTKDIKWSEAIVSESMVGSIAHSVVLIRMNEDASEKDIEEAKEIIKENANPNKWICVTADKVEVISNGDLILLVMSDEEKVTTISENFSKIN